MKPGSTHRPAASRRSTPGGGFRSGPPTAAIRPSMTSTVPPSMGSPSTGTTYPPAIAMLPRSWLPVTRHPFTGLPRDEDRAGLRGPHRLLQRGQVVRAVVADAVDEERRRARDGGQVRGVDVLGDPRRADVLAQVGREPRGVEP